MTISTLSSRELDQDVSRAQRASRDGPVFITDRGKPTHVLLSIADYRALTGGPQKIADLLAMPDLDELELEPRRDRAQAADLS